MKQTLLSLLACVLAAGLLHPADVAAAPKRFAGDAIGASANEGRKPRHRFVVGSGYSLRLRDRRASHTRFRVCRTRPATRRHCQRGRTGSWSQAGYSAGFTFAIAPDPGRYVYRWYVRGREVAAWRVDIGAGD